MRIDVNDLRRHYESLSDEGLLEIDRGDLTDVARTCYDEEVRSRGLDKRGTAMRRQPARESPASASEPVSHEPEETGADWLEDAAEAYSEYIHPGSPATRADRAREVLSTAGIPVQVEMVEEPPEAHGGAPRQRLRVLVPGHLNLQATSILECEIFNEEFEASWRAHLEGLSNEELEEVTPEIAFGGLIDKIERVTKAYEEELARRGLTE